MQKLWTLKTSWDQSLPADLDSKWRRFRHQLLDLNLVEIPRFVLCPEPKEVQLHGFADASMEAYGVCFYIRSVDISGAVFINLLCAKTRVAPLKSLTIPRLELCAAGLLVQMLDKIKNSLRVSFSSQFLWSDSSICLSWIKTEPYLLKTFVQNRVAQIQQLTNPNDWHHISTTDNPADCLSRGVTPTELISLDLYWSGPSWLKEPQEAWPRSSIYFKGELPELKISKTTVHAVTSIDPLPITKFSSFSKLCRVTAWCLRFAQNCSVAKQCRNVEPLKASELAEATYILIKVSQKETFPDEIDLLLKLKPLPPRSKILNLNPFIDPIGILRVGGRLQQSSLDYQGKHPIILHNKAHLTRILFFSEHLRLCHAGPQQLLYSLRQRYWPINGRNIARKTVHGCVRCFRAKPTIERPIMGNLPKQRVNPAPPFHVTGLDYAGPVFIKSKGGRGSRVSKAYICLFICFTTKCIHIELVSDLSTASFIAAFRRFVSRRGRPFEVFSDNGSNFIGAKAELIELGKFISNNRSKLQETFSDFGVNWNFIPSYSPHMGGYWEAGIKSAKFHLKRVLADAKCTFEELYTVLVEIEGILNSRPITPLSTDPNDLQALSPSHFLIGRPITALPDPDVTEIINNRLSRYQYIQKLQQMFWKRWSKEFLSELQIRTKWKTGQSSLKTGALVLLKDDNAPPCKWALGRVLKLHFGPDGVPRVADVNLGAGKTVRRTFAKLCALPLEQSEPEVCE